MARGIRPAGRLTASPPNAPSLARHGGQAWLGLAASLALAALAGQAAHLDAFDWQPARAWSEPWRLFSAVAVHYSALHLAANLAGAGAVAALGGAARLPPRCSLAWGLAWPLSQLGLLLQPALLHYGGWSGVLHAGVAVAGVHLAWRARGTPRAIGWALLIALMAKVLSEAPWGPPLRHPAGWDIAIAPLAHATGLLAGLICGLVVEVWVAARAQVRMRRTNALVE